MKLIFLILLFSFFGNILKAQPGNHGDKVKLMGQRQINPESLRGSPFWFSDWVKGSVVLTDGERSEGIPLQYDALHDELLTYDENRFAAIKIDKATIQSFRVHVLGEDWLFEQRRFDAPAQENRFFRVLHEGNIELLCMYQVEVNMVSPYKDVNDVMRNEEYSASERYFLYRTTFGYSPIRLKRKSLLRRVGKEDQSAARQVLRQNHIEFNGRQSFVRALELFETNQIKLHL